MKFSIVTICFNEEKRILKTLESVYKQTCQDFEHIIIDGKSTDTTLKHIEECNKYYKEGQLNIYSEKDEGIYDAMNKGIEKAKGDYICFMNAGDTFYDEKVLEVVQKEINSCIGYDIYYGNTVVVYPNGEQRLQIFYDSEKNYENNVNVGSLMPCHQAIFASRKCFENNMFDLKYKFRAEVKWFIRCQLGKIGIKEIDYFICKYEYSGTSFRSESIQLSEKEFDSIFEECGIPAKNNYIRKQRKFEREICWVHILNKWLILRISGMTFEQYFNFNNIKKIAIYGYGVLGTLLVSELKNTSIEIGYIVDREKKEEFDNIPVYLLDNELAEVDKIMTGVNSAESVMEKKG